MGGCPFCIFGGVSKLQLRSTVRTCFIHECIWQTSLDAKRADVLASELTSVSLQVCTKLRHTDLLAVISLMLTSWNNICN